MRGTLNRAQTRKTACLAGAFGVLAASWPFSNLLATESDDKLCCRTPVHEIIDESWIDSDGVDHEVTSEVPNVHQVHAEGVTSVYHTTHFVETHLVGHLCERAPYDQQILFISPSQSPPFQNIWNQ